MQSEVNEGMEAILKHNFFLYGNLGPTESHDELIWLNMRIFI